MNFEESNNGFIAKVYILSFFGYNDPYIGEKTFKNYQSNGQWVGIGCFFQASKELSRQVVIKSVKKCLGVVWALIF